MKNKLSQVLKTNRTKKDMSLREFSDYLGISHTYLDKLEKGISNRNGNNIAPTVETLAKIADGLGINLVDFMWQCGYFGPNSLKMSDAKISKHKEIDLSHYIDEIKFNLLSAKKVSYNGLPVNEVDIMIIAETLEVGVELILRKSFKKTKTPNILKK